MEPFFKNSNLVPGDLEVGVKCIDITKSMKLVGHIYQSNTCAVHSVNGFCWWNSLPQFIATNRSRYLFVLGFGFSSPCLFVVTHFGLMIFLGLLSLQSIVGDANLVGSPSGSPLHQLASSN